MSKCTVNECKKSSFAGMNCKWCQKDLCIKHRFPETHDCQGLERKKAEARKRLVETLPKVTTDKIKKV